MNLNPFAWPFRAQYFAGFLVCAALLAFAYYVQFDLGIEPCPLCIFQRIAFILIGLVFLVGAMHGPQARGRRAYGLLALVAAAAGVAIAARHIWIQHQPPDPLVGCAPNLGYMLETFPISKTLKMAFTGHADCSEVSWAWLGLSMPEWTLICYVLLGAGAVWAGFRQRR